MFGNSCFSRDYFLLYILSFKGIRVVLRFGESIYLHMFNPGNLLDRSCTNYRVFRKVLNRSRMELKV